MSSKYFGFVKSRWFLAIACVLAGALIVLGIRFLTYTKPNDIHYHANFALYLNGQREQFKGAQYYTETEMCAANSTMTPSQRAHMHDNVNDVVHVEDQAVTWGQFFSNLGWTLGSNFIQAPDNTMYVESGSQKLNIILNGQDYTDLQNMANIVIKDKDRLLISFGGESSDSLTRQYKTVPSTASHYDTAKDPSSCSGGHGPTTMHDRLVHMF